MKLNDLQKLLKEKKLDGCILYSDDPNFKYYLQEELMSGVLFIPSTGKPTVFVHRLEELEHEFNVVKLDSKEIFKEFFRKKKIGRVGYNSRMINAKAFFKLKYTFGLSDIGRELDEIRKVKTEKEVSYLKESARLADKLMQEFIKNFDFRHEKDAEIFLKTEMAKAGLEKSFEPIIASGVGAAIPHYFGSSKMRKGFFILDMGVKHKGYCSDITRTFFVGTPSKKQEELYEKVLKVQEYCVDISSEGVPCSEPFHYAKDVLGEEFNHGLGHGIGLEIHELPNLKPGSGDVFKENMVFTVEPGWYSIPGKTGIRIEDDVLIRKGRPVLLTKTKKDLICF